MGGKSKVSALFDSDSDGCVRLADDDSTDAANEMFVYSEQRMKDALVSALLGNISGNKTTESLTHLVASAIHSAIHLEHSKRSAISFRG